MPTQKKLKKIIEKHGWPGYNMVGKEAAEAAFLIVQHADKDFTFQKMALQLLQKAVSIRDADPKHMAYLIDRVKVKENLPQIYGTQINWVNGRPQPFPIEDEENVDERRIEVGLDSLAAYLKNFQ